MTGIPFQTRREEQGKERGDHTQLGGVKEGFMRDTALELSLGTERI